MTVSECVALDRGKTCGASAVVLRPVALCRKHLAAVVHQATRHFISEGTYLPVSADDELAIGHAQTVNPSMYLQGRHDPVVYFLSNGARVKIGTTMNLKDRIANLSLRPSDIALLLLGGPTLERALHRRFIGVRVGNTEWFNGAGPVSAFVAARSQEWPTSMFTRQGAANPLTGDHHYPDGRPVGRREWPDLYRVFLRLCEEQGHATKEDLVEHGPFGSRDTVRRALDVWLGHGVLVRKEGRAEQFYLT